jgi:hypothetical protein
MPNIITIRNFITTVFEAILTLDTVAYAAGDVLANPTTILLPRMPVDGDPLRAEVISAQIIDEDAQAQAMDLVLLRSNQNLGTINVAPSISDVNAREIVGIIPVLSTDYKSLAGSSQAMPQFNAIPFELPAGTNPPNLYIAAISRGTGTYTAAGVRVRLGIRFHNINQG